MRSRAGRRRMVGPCGGVRAAAAEVFEAGPAERLVWREGQFWLVGCEVPGFANPPGDPREWDPLRDTERAARAAEIDRVVAATRLSDDIVGWRAILSPALRAGIGRTCDGATIVDRAWLSAVTDRRVLEALAPEGALLVRIRARAGILCAPIGWGTEAGGDAAVTEMLFPRDSRLSITGVKRDGRTVVLDTVLWPGKGGGDTPQGHPRPSRAR